ncbi:sensor histidine kinase [Actinopolymorpha sp. NPDC004070]|uniref:sensor histidine kinase n=1 Tax=Actinopolymorpha sp. NPDC004070 TaxID=3154548 RepID=UPI0033B1D0E4
MRLHQLYDWPRRRPYLVDGALAASIATFGLPVGYAVDQVLGLLVSTALIVPLVWRRRYPMRVFLVVTLACLAQVLFMRSPIGADVAFLFALYSASAYSRQTAARVGALLVGAVGSFLGPVDWGLFTYSSRGALDVLLPGLVLLAMVALVWTFGDLMRTRRAYVGELEERARRLEFERDQQARLARSAERARIARELHDVIAHSLSVVVAQADGGLYAGAKDAEAARTALATIGKTGRQALAEMRRLLGVLRTDSAPSIVSGEPAGAWPEGLPYARSDTRPDGWSYARSGHRFDPGPDGDAGPGRGTVRPIAAEPAGPDLSPQPSLAQLPDLIEQVRASGLPIEVQVDGHERPLTGGTELAAYRVVQEALTNTLKHGGPRTSATVRLRYDQDRLRIHVLDDGRGGAAHGDGNGHGILGMRERVAVYGGLLRAGPRIGGGFEVLAEIPLSADETRVGT